MEKNSLEEDLKIKYYLYNEEEYEDSEEYEEECKGYCEQCDEYPAVYSVEFGCLCEECHDQYIDGYRPRD